MQNRITSLFNIQYPVIQGGMIWCSGWELASAVSNAGGLGLIGSGSMYPDILREHIQKCKKATNKPFGINTPLLYPQMDEVMKIIIEEGIKIVFSSAGSPHKWTPLLKSHGVKVVHVVSSSKFALKAEEAGVDAIVAEGFEAGGHNGKDETTTLCLIPLVKNTVRIPVIAAGGIASGKAMLAAMILGADGVQMGSRFVCSEESSAHVDFKKKVLELKEGGTILSLKQLVPVRLIKNEFFFKVEEAEKRGASVEELKEILGRARAKVGMFEGNLQEGELEIGQVSSHLNEIQPVKLIMENLITQYRNALQELKHNTNFIL